MKAFYKIENNKAQVGSGTPPDNTWVVYEVGQEPQDLLDVLNSEAKEQELHSKIQEAKSFLDSTQFKFGDDYDKKDTLEWLELKAKRQEAREFIRNNK